MSRGAVRQTLYVLEEDSDVVEVAFFHVIAVYDCHVDVLIRAEFPPWSRVVVVGALWTYFRCAWSAFVFRIVCFEAQRMFNAVYRHFTFLFDQACEAGCIEHVVPDEEEGILREFV